jgi:tetratricopeptide (TPR) repeat protein
MQLNFRERKQWAWAALLVLVTVLVHSPALKAGFIWDDDLLLTENKNILSDTGLQQIWTYSLDAEYYPITWTSFWLEWRLWGMNSKGYHATNILFHVLGTLLVWRVLVRLRIPGAWWAALFFAIHPVNVESVAWISERKNTLSLVFYALTMLTFLRYNSGGASGWYWGALASFLAALLSKTSGIMLPVVLLLCVWWQQGRIHSRDLWHVAPFFLLAAVIGLLTLSAGQWESANPSSFHTMERPLWFRFGAVGHVFWFYAGKAMLPVNLMAVYPLWRFDSLTPAFWLPTLAVMTLAGIAWWFRATWGRSVLFALLYFGVMLFPVLGVFNMPYTGRSPIVTDHLQYLAIIGIIGLAVAGIMSLPRAIGNATAIVILGMLAVLSVKRATCYEDPVKFWTDTLAKNPQASRAHYNLGVHYDKLDRYDEALKHYAAALDSEPNYYKGHNNMAKILIRQGKLTDAIEHFRTTVRLRPNQPDLRFNYGLALFLAKRFPEAVVELKQVIRYQPRNANAHACLASAYAQLGKTNEAHRYFAEAARLNPNHPDYVRFLPR